MDPARNLLDKLACLCLKAQGLQLYRAAGRRFRPAVRVSAAGPEEACRMLKAIAPSGTVYQSGPDVTPFVAYLRAIPAGYVELVRRALLGGDIFSFWLFSLYVPGRYRGLGIGEELCRAVVAAAREEGAGAVTLYVHPENFPAQALYRKIGFQVITGEQELRRFYLEQDTPCPPVVMQKRIV